MPTQWVRPVGAFTIGSSCGPITNPWTAEYGSPAPFRGVCTIGSPRTMPGTVDPVGAMRSLLKVDTPLAYQMDST